MNSNTVLILLTLLGIIMLITALYIKSKRERPDVQQSEKITLDRLLDIVKYSLADLVKDENFAGLADEEFESMYKRKARIKDAMTNCVYGIDSAKLIVQDLIRSTIAEVLKTEEDILQVFDFKAGYLEPRIKFEILMYFYKKRHGKDALAYMMDTYDLARPKYIIEDKSQASYAVTNEEIDEIYAKEGFELTYPVMLDILAVIIYQKYKGFGIVDTLREMNINGFNCGTSGSILSALLNKDRKVMTAPRSVWLYYRGKYIHMRFMTFHSEEELRRVVQLICRYNNPGPLTEKRGYLVNTMFDKSRVLALRPPASEYWAVFVRKFTLSNATTEGLLVKSLDEKKYPAPEKNADIMARLMRGEIIEGYIGRPDLAVNLIKYLMMGQVTCGVTGRQGSGKTTLMTSMIRFIDPAYTIRVLEMAPEMYLRELYPERNILSVQETEWVTASELQDALKKSDAAVSIVGEVATDIIAARMIQMGRVASIFTIFSHHANTAPDLIYAIRDSLVNASGGGGDLLVAERNAIDVIRVDIHLNYNTAGERYVERVSEIIKLDEGVPYPELDKKDLAWSKANLDREYYLRQTDRKTFTTRDILKYNGTTKTYETLDWFTPQLTTHMLEVMPPQELNNFKRFIRANWRL